MRRLLLLITMAGVLPSTPRVESSMFRGDAAHTGVYMSPAPALSTTVWKFKTGGKVFSSPTLADGVVYVGSADRYLYALRATDGTLVWKFATGLAISSSPAVSDGLVYVTS